MFCSQFIKTKWANNHSRAELYLRNELMHLRFISVVYRKSVIGMKLKVTKLKLQPNRISYRIQWI